MSLFNKVVPLHDTWMLLVTAIRWGLPFDPEQKYPLKGRIRYVWMGDNYKTIKLLLKDGPSSWSKEKDEIIEQLKRHESLIKYEIYEKDPVYIIAEFEPITEWDWIKGISKMDTSFHMQGKILDITSYQIAQLAKKILPILEEGDKVAMIAGQDSLLTDPFEIFYREMELTQTLAAAGITTEAAAEVRKTINDALDNGDSIINI